MSKNRLASALLLFGLAACNENNTPAADKEPLTGAALGQWVFRQCANCHSVAPPGERQSKFRLSGPNLWGVVGRPSAALDNYGYSSAMRRANLVWDEETLDRFIANPQKLVPGTRMSSGGEADPQRREALIEYLKTLNESAG